MFSHRHYSFEVDDLQPINEINMTPFIDVMLVLLIIFMISAPMMLSSIHVNLPKESTTPLVEDSPPLVVTIDRTGKYFLGDQEIGKTLIVEEIRKSKDSMDRKILIRGDQNAPYGYIADLMAMLSKAGYKKIALLTQKDSL